MSRCFTPRAAMLGLLSLFIALLSGVAGCSFKSNRTIRIVTSFSMQGVALGRSVANAVQLAVEENGGQEAGFLIEVVALDDGTETGQWDPEMEAANELGLEVLGHVTIDRMADDYQELLEPVAETTPDLIYFGGYTPNGAHLLVRQMREMGMDTGFMGPDAIVDSAFIAGAGEAAEGVYATLVGVPPSGWTEAESAHFANRYRERFGAEPEAFSHFAYDAATAVMTAIEQAGTRDRRAILNAMTTSGKMDGLGGCFTFDINGDTTITTVSGSMVHNGTFQYLETLAP